MTEFIPTHPKSLISLFVSFWNFVTRARNLPSRGRRGDTPCQNARNDTYNNINNLYIIVIPIRGVSVTTRADGGGQPITRQRKPWQRRCLAPTSRLPGQAGRRCAPAWPLPGLRWPRRPVGGGARYRPSRPPLKPAGGPPWGFGGHLPRQHQSGGAPARKTRMANDIALAAGRAAAGALAGAAIAGGRHSIRR